MSLTPDTDFTKYTDAELIQIKAKWDPVSKIYLKVVNELCNRQEIKEQKNKNLQNDIKRMTFWILILTIILTVLTVCSLFF